MVEFSQPCRLEFHQEAIVSFLFLSNKRVETKECKEADEQEKGIVGQSGGSV